MTEADWIKIIREFPADPFHRLGFSDWLEDRGDGERAELVRQTCKGERKFVKILPAKVCWRQFERNEKGEKWITSGWSNYWKPEYTLNLKSIHLRIRVDEGILTDWKDPGLKIKVGESVVDARGFDGTNYVCLWNCKVLYIAGDSFLDNPESWWRDTCKIELEALSVT